MCTVSVIAQPGLLRLVSNRDERRSRAAAIPPSSRSIDGVRVLAPTDPVSGGTWIACNAAGLAIALLNVNPAKPDGRVPPRSRGDIVPFLIKHKSLDNVAAAASQIDTTLYAPFRLVAVHADVADVLELVPAIRKAERHTLAIPRMFTSSGLGDAQVEGPRRELFNRLVIDEGPGDRRAQQDQFHAHRWSDRPELSVWMARDDAWTVSRTMIEIGEREIVMHYAAEPDWIDQPARLTRGSTT
jgi:hypothetical protein